MTGNIKLRTGVGLVVLGLFCLVQGAGATENSLSLRIQAKEAEIAVYEPLAVEITLLNPSSKEVGSVPWLISDERGHEGGLRFVVVENGKERPVKEPVLILMHADSEPGPADFVLQPKGEVGVSMALAMDWADDTPLFGKPGSYELYVTLDIPGTGKLESHRIPVRVRETRSDAEKKAVALLEQDGVHKALYSGDLSLIKVKPSGIVRAVRAVYGLGKDLPWSSWVLQRLQEWRALEAQGMKVTEAGGLAPRQQGWDNLGLQDLDLPVSVNEMFKCSVNYPAKPEAVVPEKKNVD